jgi:preprotein translocase subunit YajC
MNIMTVIMLVVLGVFFFISQRQQNKQQQERKKQLEDMKPGDEIITIGGLHGLLHEIDKEKGTITLDCEGIYLVFEHTAIRTIKPETENAKAVEIKDEKLK